MLHSFSHSKLVSAQQDGGCPRYLHLFLGVTITMPLVAYRRAPAAILLVLLVSACAPLIGPYTQRAYENATSLKPETLALMEKAREPFSDHRAAVDALLIELQQAHEYVKGVRSSSISAQQWEILIAPDGDLFGKFIKRWKERGTLSDTYIHEFKGPVTDAFDEIICLEANKKEPTVCRTTNGA